MWPKSGPLDEHLLRDVGVAYAVLALGLGLAFAGRSQARFATLATALYFGGHAALHAFMDVAGRGGQTAWAEAPGVYLPAIAASAIALRFGYSAGRRGSVNEAAAHVALQATRRR